ncbi:minor capsid protein [Ligilactobacillus murinus]|uniref:minor capsid protein n=1 Tax=Ligilactobacillus murinus TaxID=1622 RepID=UPI001F035678|nr:minor capsid protein [Ligilactobacillus murinus]
MEYLKAQVGLELVKVTNKEQKELDEYLNTAYLDEVKRQSGILSKHKSQEVAKKARVVASASFQGATWSDRLWINQTVLKTKLDALISRAMIQGTNPTQLVSMLRKNVAQEVKNATSVIERLVITETARVQDEATMRSFRANGFKFCKWIAEPTACKYCKEMAEKSTEYGIGVYPVMDAPMIPKHPRCRCSKAAYWVDKRLIDKVKKDIKEYRELVDILGKDSTPKSLEMFRNMKYNDVEKYKDLKERVIWHQAKFPTEKSFNGHFLKHAKEFDENLTKEQYRNLAAKLLSQSISMHVLGYDTEYRRVRYDKKNNIFALGDNKRKTVITLLKPIEGVKYYEADWQREFGDNK